MATGVVAVGALSESSSGYRVADFSNTFPEISSPGVDILPARAGGGLKRLSGTSMATPHVTGVTALWWQALNDHGMSLVNARNVTAKLLASARPEVFADGVQVPDRGVGMVTAPA